MAWITKRETCRCCGVQLFELNGWRHRLYCPACYKVSAKQRFETKCSSSRKTGCINWLGAKLFGYGIFSYKDPYFLETKAHRVAWLLAYGTLPAPSHAGGMILHTCDNRACVNVAHLYIGSHKQNMQDTRLRGRAAKGERNGAARNMTEYVVREIRTRYPKGGISIPQLAKEFDVARSAVWCVIHRKTWKHVK